MVLPPSTKGPENSMGRETIKLLSIRELWHRVVSGKLTFAHQKPTVQTWHLFITITTWVISNQGIWPRTLPWSRPCPRRNSLCVAFELRPCSVFGVDVPVVLALIFRVCMCICVSVCAGVRSWACVCAGCVCVWRLQALRANSKIIRQGGEEGSEHVYSKPCLR